MSNAARAKELAKELYELCEDPDVCASIANMIWDANDTEQMAGNDAEDALDNAAYGETVEMQPALRLPNFFGRVEPPNDSHCDPKYVFTKHLNGDLF